MNWSSFPAHYFVKIQNPKPKIQKNVLLKNYTTFKIGGPARYFLIAKTKEDLIKAVLWAKKNNLPFFILGGGSNLLVADRGFDGVVIKIKNDPEKISSRFNGARKLKIKNHNLKSKIIYTEAGVGLTELVNLSLKKGLTGLEWAAGIPGTVGGAIRGNAGSFGREMKDITKTVTVLETKNQKPKIKNLNNKDCKFGYRDSIFKHNPDLIILSCELQLKKRDKKAIREKVKGYLDYRRERHPKEPSAGSIFKNINLKELPSGFFKKFPETKDVIKENALPAAYLISQCHLQGKKISGAQISEIHPNFIVNLDEAKAGDVLKLINSIKKKVREKFNITLKEEIQLLGF